MLYHDHSISSCFRFLRLVLFCITLLAGIIVKSTAARPFPIFLTIFLCVRHTKNLLEHFIFFDGIAFSRIIFTQISLCLLCTSSIKNDLLKKVYYVCVCRPSDVGVRCLADIHQSADQQGVDS